MSANDPVILVIDDDLDFREGLRGALKAFGFRVIGAANGQVALRVLRRIEVDAIVLDIDMPVMNGWAFLSARMAEPDLIEVPVVVLTGKTDQDRLAQYTFAIGGLAKPCPIGVLVNTLRAAAARLPPRKIKPGPAGSGNIVGNK